MKNKKFNFQISDQLNRHYFKIGCITKKNVYIEIINVIYSENFCFFRSAVNLLIMEPLYAKACRDVFHIELVYSPQNMKKISFPN